MPLSKEQKELLRAHYGQGYLSHALCDLRVNKTNAKAHRLLAIGNGKIEKSVKDTVKETFQEAADALDNLTPDELMIAEHNVPFMDDLLTKLTKEAYPQQGETWSEKTATFLDTRGREFWNFVDAVWPVQSQDPALREAEEETEKSWFALLKQYGQMAWDALRTIFRGLRWVVSAVYEKIKQAIEYAGNVFGYLTNTLSEMSVDKQQDQSVLTRLARAATFSIIFGLLNFAQMVDLIQYGREQAYTYGISKVKLLLNKIVDVMRLLHDHILDPSINAILQSVYMFLPESFLTLLNRGFSTVSSIAERVFKWLKKLASIVLNLVLSAVAYVGSFVQTYFLAVYKRVMGFIWKIWEPFSEFMSADDVSRLKPGSWMTERYINELESARQAKEEPLSADTEQKIESAKRMWIILQTQIDDYRKERYLKVVTNMGSGFIDVPAHIAEMMTNSIFQAADSPSPSETIAIVDAIFYVQTGKRMAEINEQMSLAEDLQTVAMDAIMLERMGKKKIDAEFIAAGGNGEESIDSVTLKEARTNFITQVQERLKILITLKQRLNELQAQTGANARSEKSRVEESILAYEHALHSAKQDVEKLESKVRSITNYILAIVLKVSFGLIIIALGILMTYIKYVAPRMLMEKAREKISAFITKDDQLNTHLTREITGLIDTDVITVESEQRATILTAFRDGLADTARRIKDNVITPKQMVELANAFSAVIERGKDSENQIVGGFKKAVADHAERTSAATGESWSGKVVDWATYGFYWVTTADPKIYMPKKPAVYIAPTLATIMSSVNSVQEYENQQDAGRVAFRDILADLTQLYATQLDQHLKKKIDISLQEDTLPLSILLYKAFDAYFGPTIRKYWRSAKRQTLQDTETTAEDIANLPSNLWAGVTFINIIEIIQLTIGFETILIILSMITMLIFIIVFFGTFVRNKDDRTLQWEVFKNTLAKYFIVLPLGIASVVALSSTITAASWSATFMLAETGFHTIWSLIRGNFSLLNVTAEAVKTAFFIFNSYQFVVRFLLPHFKQLWDWSFRDDFAKFMGGPFKEDDFNKFMETLFAQGPNLPVYRIDQLWRQYMHARVGTYNDDLLPRLKKEVARARILEAQSDDVRDESSLVVRDMLKKNMDQPGPNRPVQDPGYTQKREGMTEQQRQRRLDALRRAWGE